MALASRSARGAHVLPPGIDGGELLCHQDEEHDVREHEWAHGSFRLGLRVRAQAAWRSMLVPPTVSVTSMLPRVARE
jgi:hypothetical protein